MGDAPQKRQRRTTMATHMTARALGVASFGVAAAELLAPRQLEQTMGIGNGEITGIMRVLGVRELMHGIDILTHENPKPGIWARVAGDMLDGVVLAIAGAKSRNISGFAAVAAAVAPVVIADMVCAMMDHGE